MTGKIIKGIAGFYYVHVAESGIYECKAKGIFRKDNTKPLVGDEVKIEILCTKDMEGNITEILPRKNSLIRPAVANVDQAIVLFAVKSPKPHLNLLDRFLVSMESCGIPTIICFNKIDLDNGKEMKRLRGIYDKTDYPLIFSSVKEMQNIDTIKEAVKGKTTVLAGPSGAGKSSLINVLQSDVQMEVGALSEKIARGKHTTRHSELITMGEEGYLLDTPGFSSLFIEDLEKEELKDYFPEFCDHEENCYFSSCMHLKEPDCGVKDAVAKSVVSQSRYDNYVTLFDKLDEPRWAKDIRKK
jgi:ribosome biogenesis GTPase